MMYSIPVNKIEKLTKIINRYNKKGANIIFNIGEDVVEEGTLYLEDKINHCMKSFPIKVNCKRVFVDGVYVIKGWQFVGTIEFTENGNIIRLADSSFEGKIPLKYLHTPKICEHCGKIRNRKDTYLIYNVDSGEFKQVGSTCLLDYTKGLDADECANIMSCLDKVSSLCDFNCDDESFFGNGFDSTSFGFDRMAILPLVYAYVSEYGYERMFEGHGTAQDVRICVLQEWGYLGEELSNYYQTRYNSLVMPSAEDMKAIDEYAKAHLDDANDYMRNASLSWLKGNIEYRDFGLVASFVATYRKEINKAKLQALQQKSKSNAWVGNVGDRITIKVASIRCLYTNTIEIAWHVYVSTFLYEITDTEGHVYIWKSSNNIEVKEIQVLEKEGTDWYKSQFVQVKPLEIVATVKEHSTYKDLKQTVLTRGKVTASEQIN